MSHQFGAVANSVTMATDAVGGQTLSRQARHRYLRQPVNTTSRPCSVIPDTLTFSPNCRSAAHRERGNPTTIKHRPQGLNKHHRHAPLPPPRLGQPPWSCTRRTSRRSTTPPTDPSIRMSWSGRLTLTQRIPLQRKPSMALTDLPEHRDRRLGQHTLQRRSAGRSADSPSGRTLGDRQRDQRHDHHLRNGKSAAARE